MVVLDDRHLREIEQSGQLIGGGDPDPPPTTNGTCGGFNDRCINEIHCRTTHNKTCTNYRICPDEMETVGP
jgi:hypothetical protein